MASPDKPSLQFIGARYLGEGLIMSVMLTFEFNGVNFFVVAASPDDEAGGETLVPPGYRFEESLEGKMLAELTDLTWGEFDKGRIEASKRLEKQLANMAADVALTTMQHLAPTPIPPAETLQSHLYPQTYTLQILTDGSKLTCRPTPAGYTGIPELTRSVSEERLHTMGLDIHTTNVPVIKASQVGLVRRLQGFVWRVTVQGEDMVYKSATNVFEDAIGDELAAYLKIRTSGVELGVPELKGIVESHKGVIGILLAYIPHKHHSLHALLDGVESGTIAPSEATTSQRQKWATQIRATLAGLHGLGILWRDLKTNNVLINEDDDAVVLDFGGGNTIGWVDHDKYGSMEGEEQGLEKIMLALRVGPD
ncbi:uncharacterized protein B0H64DRAFT_389253 [Chaetomium fimeti]|uniref:Protein kinase domain-containing protein n=1 Tax=Chaetomium fimeti TaxID=1854472 RepID=A0AAE0HNE0_9PEZI|nr:hypothetical protein B0H64DRAFT_389253 [Chaetomium fimeti]